MAKDAGINPNEKVGWWPDIGELLKADIEIISVVQETGDLVVVPTNWVHFGFTLVSFFFGIIYVIFFI